MPTILKARKVHNPGKKKRKKLSPKQIRIFGTKAQKAALKRKRNSGRKRSKQRNFPGGSRIHSWSTSKRTKAKPIKRHVNKGRKRRKKQFNVGEILTAGLAGNPGRKKMARTRKRSRKSSHRRTRNRRVVHNTRRRRRSRRNSSPRVVVRYRNRSRRRHARRRNAGAGNFLSGSLGKVVGILAGAGVTTMLNGFVPAQFSSGIFGYISTGIVAYAQGKMIGKITKNKALGDNMIIGGMVVVALKVIGDMVPSIGAMLPFSLRGGMGLIAPSNFYVPQVNQPGSMSSFISPAAIASAAPVAMAGMGRGRRVGRMGY